MPFRRRLPRGNLPPGRRESKSPHADPAEEDALAAALAAFLGQGSRYESPPYPNQDRADLIAAIRIDLSSFTRGEFEILQNHSYLRATEKTLRYGSRRFRPRVWR